MIDPLPPHIWFARGHYWGDGYAPIRREGWQLLARYMFCFIADALAVVILALFFPRFELWIFIAGGMLLLLAAWRLNGLLRKHGDLSVSVRDYHALRAPMRKSSEPRA